MYDRIILPGRRTKFFTFTSPHERASGNRKQNQPNCCFFNRKKFVTLILLMMLLVIQASKKHCQSNNLRHDGKHLNYIYCWPFPLSEFPFRVRSTDASHVPITQSEWNKSKKFERSSNEMWRQLVGPGILIYKRELPKTSSSLKYVPLFKTTAWSEEGTISFPRA